MKKTINRRKFIKRFGVGLAVLPVAINLTTSTQPGCTFIAKKGMVEAAYLSGLDEPMLIELGPYWLKYGIDPNE